MPLDMAPSLRRSPWMLFTPRTHPTRESPWTAGPEQTLQPHTGPRWRFCFKAAACCIKYLTYIRWCCLFVRWRREHWEIKLMEQPDEHYSLVGGNLVITNPRQDKHAGTYICVARNIYGTVISKEARVKFGCEHLKPRVLLNNFWKRSGLFLI